MIAREHIVLILILMIFQSANGQTGNHLVDGVGFHYTFDEDNELTIDYVEYKDLLTEETYSFPFCLSDYNGKMLTYGNIIPYHPDNIPSDLHEKRTINSCVMRLSDSVCLIFYLQEDIRKHWRDTLKRYTHYRVLNIKNGIGKFANEPATLLIDKHIHSIASIRDTSGGFWLVAKHDTLQFTSYYFNQSIRPIFTSSSTISRDPLFLDIPTYYDKASPSGNFLTSRRFGIHENTDSFELRRTSYMLLAFDKATGAVTEDRILYQETDTFWNRAFDEKNNAALRRTVDFGVIEVSANEKYTYLGEREGSTAGPQVNKLLRVNNETLVSEILRSELNNLSVDPLSLGLRGVYVSFNDIKLLNNRKIYLKKRLFYDNTQIGYYAFDCIDAPNEASSSIVEEALISPGDRLIRGPHLFSNTPYNYLIVKPSITRAECTTQVTFIDKCDYSLPDTKVTYYAEDIAGSGVLVPKGENPTLNFTRSGNYLCKVILKSHLGTYKEVWYRANALNFQKV
jgi:hypothetical protein